MRYLDQELYHPGALFTILALALAVGCEPPVDEDDVLDEVDPGAVMVDPVETGPPVAFVAQIHPLSGTDVRGQATFVDLGEDIHVEAYVTGLGAGQRHGFHVHEGTSCDEPGDHFAPFDRPHGHPDDPPQERHQGDLGNLEATDEGAATYSRTIEGVFLTEAPSMVGRAVVVHEGADDPEIQPFGDAGDLIACGIIEEVPQP